MTETRFTWRWLLVIAFAGILMGLVAGLVLGWVIVPQVGTSEVAGLSASAQNDYIVLVANTYAYDQDLPRAKSRLAQLKDDKIALRVERLAKSFGARQDPDAANLADLALALGSQDSSLEVMAEKVSNTSDAEPTKVARADVEVSPTDAAATTQPTATRKKNKPTAAPTEAAPEATETPVPSTAPSKVAATRAPQPTAAPTQPAAAPPLSTDFIPEFPAKWWDAVKFIPASVAPGQQYWRLRYARYCDWAPTDKFDPCPGFPAGTMGTYIYVMTVDEQGNCVTTNVTDEINDGSLHPLTPDMVKKIDYPWNPYNFSCTQDYEKEMYGEGNSMSVPGLPSDKITELSLCSKSPPPGYNPPPCGHVHVRYFLIFQRTTR